ncbi:3-ketoacyl-ACP reductase [Roseovarius litorisediminis]|nr:3-ketoacyl-ACP reductase [Roseovarius litorisediminis]
MEESDLHDRLEALSAKISKARTRLDNLKAWSDGHRLSSGELEARYRYLKSELNGEIKDMETHGHHVSKLEASLREWLDSLELYANWE